MRKINGSNITVAKYLLLSSINKLFRKLIDNFHRYFLKKESKKGIMFMTKFEVLLYYLYRKNEKINSWNLFSLFLTRY